MRFFLRPLFLGIGFFVSSFLNISSYAKDSGNNPTYFQHNIQLQLTDALGFAVSGAQFWVALDVVVNGPLVTISFPVINFETVATSYNPYDIPPLVPGGYLYTSAGFLPSNICPTDLVNRSIVAASNNGMSPAFSFTQSPSTLPQPPSGYIVQVTNAGAVVIQCAGTFGNIIPPGGQVMLPCSITYMVKPQAQFTKNTIIGAGFTNTTQFTNYFTYYQGFRNFHVNDAYNGVVAWTWTDNSMVADKTNGVMNCMVAIGHSDAQGNLTVSSPIQLSDLEPGYIAWCTAAAINRTNPDNIVVSYAVIYDDNFVEGDLISGQCYRAVSMDGGKTWPVNGNSGIPITGNPPLGIEIRGVASDKFGNIWYQAGNFYDNSGNEREQEFFAVSSDGGVTYTIICTLAQPPLGSLDQYPQYCFGQDGSGNYGLLFSLFVINENTDDAIPYIGFIPILEFNSFGTPQLVSLPSFINNMVGADITASADGRVWLQGTPNSGGAFNYNAPVTLLFKSPGPLNQNYAGPWHQGFFPNLPTQYALSTQDSQPAQGYFQANTVQSIIYDDSRQALYALLTQPRPDYGQNMYISFIISRDNGQTWSNPILISNSRFANRGFQSMALDTVNGNLVFGWYDGRNDPTFQSVQYFGAILPAAQLTSLVNAIPLSNPLYTLPPAGPTGITGCGG